LGPQLRCDRAGKTYLDTKIILKKTRSLGDPLPELRDLRLPPRNGMKAGRVSRFPDLFLLSGNQFASDPHRLELRLMNGVLSSAEKLLAQMSRAEKAQVAAWTLDDLGSAWPGIEAIEDVCDGDACIAGTRIPVWLGWQGKVYRRTNQIPPASVSRRRKPR
jgi:hypothetical protein